MCKHQLWNLYFYTELWREGISALPLKLRRAKFESTILKGKVQNLKVQFWKAKFERTIWKYQWKEHSYLQAVIFLTWWLSTSPVGKRGFFKIPFGGVCSAYCNQLICCSLVHYQLSWIMLMICACGFSYYKCRRRWIKSDR